MATTSAESVQVAARLRLAVTRTARRLRQEAGGDLTPSLTAALGTIDVHGPLTPSELAERERVQRPTATRLIARLAEAGLVTRTSDPSDGRVSLVSMTSEGRTLMRRLRTAKTAYLAKRLRDLDAEEIETLDRAAEILERLLERDSA
jgi:DNA-binding MarR family transcriptional regulator